MPSTFLPTPKVSRETTQPLSAIMIKRNNVERPLYLDNQATTPMDPRVLDAMLPFMTSNFGNPHSRSHSFGWQTEEACEDARKEVA